MADKGIGVSECDQHGEYYLDAKDSPCPSCEEEVVIEIKEEVMDEEVLQPTVLELMLPVNTEHLVPLLACLNEHFDVQVSVGFGEYDEERLVLYLRFKGGE
jgi:hypothetical protein